MTRAAIALLQHHRDWQVSSESVRRGALPLIVQRGLGAVDQRQPSEVGDVTTSGP